MRRLRRLTTAVLVVAGVFGAAGCSAAAVPLKPAADANDPLCAEVSVRLPSAFENSVGPAQERRWTDAQATGAWGDPVSVTVTCGLEPPGPSTLQCVTFQNVDWLVDPTDAPWLRITSYGRTPAVQVNVNSTAISPDSVLDALGPKLATLPVDARCTAPDTNPTAQPTP
ncbi:hypothetical protein J2Y69_000539 [Microbacterium resistens]|uniref:DUF3515 family protein n=1 Tax=Microbacterium resistens TaxID=156977 RepID=A0ABU1S8M5_9MICO|nr:DUF3515 family protein [Microbacterium resistens]MDR6865954.1 hypothetical protein [Microbacterium resistens]